MPLLAKACSKCLAEGNRGWVKNAPVLPASVAATPRFITTTPNRWVQHDTGAANDNFGCKPYAGFVAHQMGGFDADKAKAVACYPADHTCMAMIAVGHPAPADGLPDVARMGTGAGERASRSIESPSPKPLGPGLPGFSNRCYSVKIPC